MNSESTNPEELQNEWKEMYQHTLPSAALSKSPSQSKWPVQLDHCFARIILDTTIGISVPWTQKIKSPAYKNMSEQQLKDCIALGRKILDGEVDLVELDGRSLEVRGKGKNVKAVKENVGKRKREEQEEEKAEVEMKKRKETAVTEHETNPKLRVNDIQPSSSPNKEDLKPWLKKIALCDKSSFQKKVLSALCQVPRGKWTTYAAISAHLSSSPRAVGNALRNNPFAPQVPCHRVLASDGGLGGFHGSWGKNGYQGLHDDKKRKLLREEGVRFDGRGKVVGAPWAGFA